MLIHILDILDIIYTVKKLPISRLPLLSLIFCCFYFQFMVIELPLKKENISWKNIDWLNSIFIFIFIFFCNIVCLFFIKVFNKTNLKNNKNKDKISNCNEEEEKEVEDEAAKKKWKSNKKIINFIYIYNYN